jgi:hypothetical protein
MENTKSMKRALWINVIFIEALAIVALFFRETNFVQEVTNGQAVMIGIDLILFSGLITFAGLKKTISKSLLWVIIGLNDVILLLLISRLFDSSISTLTFEMIAIDTVMLVGIIVLEIRAMRETEQRTTTLLS